MPEWECLSGSAYVGYGTEACACKRACARAHVCSSLLLRRSLPPTAHTASSAWSSRKQRCDPPDPDISYGRTPTWESQRGTAWRNKGMSRADESHRECMQGRGGGPAGPVPLPCRASAIPCAMPRPGPPNGRSLSSALHGLTRHGTGPAVAYRVGQWPHRPCMHSRRVSSARVIPWHFRFVFLVLQHVTGPATLVSTSGVCSPSL